MANAASRLFQWASAAGAIGDFHPTTGAYQPGYSDAQLADFKNNWGVDGIIIPAPRWIGGGGNQRFTGNLTEVTNAAEWTFHRRWAASNIVPRCHARGIEVWIVVDSGSVIWSGNNYRGFFLDIWDNAAWTDLVIPAFRGYAQFAQLYGLDGIDWDHEDYFQNTGRGSIPANDPQLRPTWRWQGWGNQTGHTEAEIRAKVKSRSAELASAMCGAYPGLVMGHNFIRTPLGWNAWIQATAGNANPQSNAGGPEYSGPTGQYTGSVQMDMIAGFFSTRQIGAWIQADRSAYRNAQIIQGSYATGMKMNHLAAMAAMSRWPGMDWDYAATRYFNCGMTWIDPDGNNFSVVLTPTQVAAQLDQVTTYSSGDHWHNYEHHFPEAGTTANPLPTGSGWDYVTGQPGSTGDYRALMQAASVDRTADSLSPNVSVVSSQTVGSNQIVTGSSYDDFAIWHVSWRNTRSGATGECKLTFVDLSGRPMEPRRTGNAADPLGAFNIADYDTWRIDWDASVPLQQANDVLTFTAHDIHGLTASLNVTAGVPITPTTRPTVTQNPATGIGTTSATLSGTVNPNGLATSATFEYGLTTAYGLSEPSVNMGVGNTPVPISQNIAGLNPNTTYHFRLSATSSAGTTVATDGTFITTAVASAPLVTVTDVTVSRNDATVAGTVNPRGLATTALVDYGLTVSYGTSTPGQAMGSGSTALAFSADIAGLAADTDYHYRIRATNSAGTNSTADAVFRTTANPPGTPIGDRTGAYAAAVLNLTGIRSYWRLGETTGAVFDSAGFNTATVIGGVTRGVVGIEGSDSLAIQFDGTSGRLEVPHDSSLNLGNGPMFMLAWFKRTAADVGTISIIFDKGTAGYALHIDNDNLLKAGKADFAWGVESSTNVTDVGTSWGGYPSITVFPGLALFPVAQQQSDWHMVAMSYTGVGSGFTVWLDGVNVTGPTAAVTLEDTTAPLRIGGDVTMGRFGGTLAHLAIGSATITQAQVSQLWTLGSNSLIASATQGLITEQTILFPLVNAAPSGVHPPFIVGSITSLLRGDAYLRGPGDAAPIPDILVNIGLIEENVTLFPVTAESSRIQGVILEHVTLFPLSVGASIVGTQGLITENTTLFSLVASSSFTQGLIEENVALYPLSDFSVETPRTKRLGEGIDILATVTRHSTTAAITSRRYTATITEHVLEGD